MNDAYRHETETKKFDFVGSSCTAPVLVARHVFCTDDNTEI